MSQTTIISTSICYQYQLDLLSSWDLRSRLFWDCIQRRKGIGLGSVLSLRSSALYRSVSRIPWPRSITLSPISNWPNRDKVLHILVGRSHRPFRVISSWICLSRNKSSKWQQNVQGVGSTIVLVAFTMYVSSFGVANLLHVIYLPVFSAAFRFIFC